MASVEYRTVPEGGTYTMSAEDVRAAVAHLREHADAYGIDPRAVGVWGESAGGYVAAMTGLAPEGESGPQGRVQAVVDSFGASDLSALAADFDARARAFYEEQVTHFSAFLGRPGHLLKDIPDAVRAADPVTYATAGAPPFLLLHGSADFLISPSQTQRLHRALRAAGADSTRYVLNGANHGDISFLGDPESGRPWTTTTTLDLITGFFRERLGS